MGKSWRCDGKVKVPPEVDAYIRARARQFAIEKIMRKVQAEEAEFVLGDAEDRPAYDEAVNRVARDEEKPIIPTGEWNVSFGGLVVLYGRERIQAAAVEELASVAHALWCLIEHGAAR